MNFVRVFFALLTGVAFWSWLPLSSAQEVTSLGPERNAARVDVGIDSAWVTRLSYTRRVRLVPEHDLLVTPGVTLAVAQFDLDDSLVDIPIRTTIVAARSWKLDISFGPLLRNTTNALFRAHAVGAAVHLLPGFWSPSWGIGLNVGYEQSFTTYVQNSAKYRELIYAGARDGGIATLRRHGTSARKGVCCSGQSSSWPK